MKNALLTSVLALMIASPAVAADAVVEDYAPVAGATVYDWSGPYVGVFGGLSTGDYQYGAGPTDGPTLLTLDASGGGALGGIQIGYDHQMGSWVFGAVADIAITNHEADLTLGVAGGEASLSAESTLNYFGTVRARAGYAFDRALVYAHGGFAYGQTEQTIRDTGVTLYNDDTTRTGWTIGAGVEYALTERVTLGTEYSYVDLGSEEIFSAPEVAFVDEELKFHTVKAVVNFRF